MKTANSRASLNKNRGLKALSAALAVAVGALLIGPVANATPLTIVSNIGGAPNIPGVIKDNLNSLSTGTSGGTTANGIKISFAGTAQAVTGSKGNTYAAPDLSGGNGNGFGASGGNQANGPDATVYLTAGGTTSLADMTSFTPNSGLTLTLPDSEKYFGLLWGSVDTYNTLNFFNNGTLVGSITGTDVIDHPNGNQGPDGTTYVNINSTLPFNQVVATSSDFGFEMDNFAFGVQPIPTSVPEPGVLGMFGFGLLLIGGAVTWRRKQLDKAAKQLMA